ncbi:tandem-95 repeat protein, partial [Hydrogenophaga sp. D2P1]
VVINYTIVDQDGGTDSATHTVNVANQPPVLVDPDPTPGTPGIDPTDPSNLIVPGEDGTAVTVDLDNYFSDPNTGDTLTITPDLSSLPPGVTANYDPVTGELTVTPPVDNAGAVVIPVTVDDGNGGTFTGTITIEPVNPPPLANDDTQAASPEVATVVNLLGNDSDPDGDPLTVSTATLADPSQGTLTEVGGVWTFTSAPGVSGPVVINYTIVDQDGGTDSATHTVNVANQPPVLVDPDPTPGTPGIDPTDPSNLIVPGEDGTAVTVDLDNYFSDPNTGDTLTITPDLSSLPPGVTANYDPVTGELTVTPPVDNAGAVVIPVTVDDGNGGTFTGTITIEPVNPPPLANDDTQAASPEVATVVNLLGNDSDPDGDPLTVSTATLADPSQGTLTEVGGVWTFTSAPGVSGAVVINYTIVDQDGATDSATHTVNVAPSPLPPGPAPAPAPAPVPPLPPAPAPAPEVPDAPVWEGPATSDTSTPAISSQPGSALHVLYAVSEASNERGMFTSSLGSAGLDAGLMGEAMSQRPDSLMFDSSTWVDQVGLIKEPSPGEVQVVAPALHVQHAVRHQPIVMEQGLFVQHAVRASQLESRLRNAIVDAHNSATAGYGSLLDPFALGTSKPDGTAASVAEAEPQPARPQQATARGESEAAPQAAKAVDDAPVQKAVELPRAAQGFRAQVERMAKDRLHGSRPITRSTTVKS